MKKIILFLLCAFALHAQNQSSGFGVFPGNLGGGGGGGGQYSGTAATYTAGTYYFSPGGGASFSTTETAVQGKEGVPGSISNFTVSLGGVAPGGGVTVTFTWRDNVSPAFSGSADQSVFCSITGSATTCSDVTHNFQVGTGDLTDIKMVVAGGTLTGATVVMKWGLPGLPGPQGIQGVPGASAPHYSATVTNQTTLTVTALTHGQGTAPYAFCTDGATPPNQVNCSWSVSNTGQVVFSWPGGFTGTVEIIGWQAPYTASVSAQTSLTVAPNIHGQGATPYAFCLDNSSPANSVSCSWSVSATGQVVFSWPGGFSGTIEIVPGGGVGGGGGGGSGSLTTFSAGNLSPLFTTSVANPTTTPALSFTLSNANANTALMGPTSGGPGAPSYRAIVAGDVPTLNQNTTGTASNVTGIVLPANGGTGANNTVGSAGHYPRSNGSAYVDGAIQAADVPTLNQNTTGTAATITGLLALANTPLTTTQDILFDNAGALGRLPIVTSGQCLGNTGGVWASLACAGGSGAGMASQLGDFAVVRTNSTTLTSGGSCSSSTPCIAGPTSNPYTFVTSYTCIISAGTATAYIYVDQNGNLTCGSNGDTLSGTMTIATGISAFPAGSVPISTWTAGVSSGNWDSTGGTPQRNPYNSQPMLPGTGLLSSSSAGIYTFSLDTSYALTRAGDQVGTDNACYPGSANSTSYTCSVTPAITTYSTTLHPLLFKPDITSVCSSTCTLNINGVGPLTLQKLSSGSLVNIAAGDIVLNIPYLLLPVGNPVTALLVK